MKTVRDDIATSRGLKAMLLHAAEVVGVSCWQIRDHVPGILSDVERFDTVRTLHSKGHNRADR